MYINVNGIKVYYEIEGSGIPVIMLHGCTPDHRLMKGCMEPIFKKQEKQYKRIYFDLPGMGKTEAKPWINNCDMILELVIQFINCVIPNENYLLAGESFGGILARGLIKKRGINVQGLLLICPVGKQIDKERIVPPKTVIETDDRFLNSLSVNEREMFTYMNVLQTEDVWTRFESDILSGLSITNMDFIKRVFNGSSSFSFDTDILDAPYMNPALFIMGRQDFVCGYKDILEISDYYPRASLAVLDKTGHNLQIEQVHLFEELVSNWLKRIEENIRL